MAKVRILYEMLKTLSTQRVPMRPNTTKIVNLNFPKESIGCYGIIGPGGKTIQEIQKKNKYNYYQKRIRKRSNLYSRNFW